MIIFNKTEIKRIIIFAFILSLVILANINFTYGEDALEVYLEVDTLQIGDDKLLSGSEIGILSSNATSGEAIYTLIEEYDHEKFNIDGDKLKIAEDINDSEISFIIEYIDDLDAIKVYFENVEGEILNISEEVEIELKDKITRKRTILTGVDGSLKETNIIKTDNGNTRILTNKLGYILNAFSSENIENIKYLDDYFLENQLANESRLKLEVGDDQKVNLSKGVVDHMVSKDENLILSIENLNVEFDSRSLDFENEEFNYLEINMEKSKVENTEDIKESLNTDEDMIRIDYPLYELKLNLISDQKRVKNRFDGKVTFTFDLNKYELRDKQFIGVRIYKDEEGKYDY